MKIKFEDTRGQPSHTSRDNLIRVLVWYVGPFALLYTNDLLMSLFDSEASAKILLFPLTLFVSAFALLLFP